MEHSSLVHVLGRDRVILWEILDQIPVSSMRRCSKVVLRAIKRPVGALTRVCALHRCELLLQLSLSLLLLARELAIAWHGSLKRWVLLSCIA